MIKQHERNNIIVTIPTESLESFFTEVTKLITELDNTHRVLTEFLNGDSDEDDVYDYLSSVEFKMNELLRLSYCMPSVEDLFNKYLRNTVDVMEVLKKNVNQLVTSGYSPNENDAEILLKEVTSVVGGLTYFIAMDYDILKTYEVYKTEGSADMDEIVDAYLKSNGLGFTDFCEYFIELFTKYRFKLSLFDDYPELSEPFEQIAGPWYNLIPEGTLELTDVQSVISGTLAIEDLVAKVNPNYNEED